MAIKIHFAEALASHLRKIAAVFTPPAPSESVGTFSERAERYRLINIQEPGDPSVARQATQLDRIEADLSEIRKSLATLVRLARDEALRQNDAEAAARRRAGSRRPGGGSYAA